MNGPELTRPVELDRLDEENTSKDDLDEEFLFYRYVAAGRISKVQENCNCTAFETVAGASMLSSDPLTNLKYHFVVTAAMLARTCSEGGMASAEAFELSSVYIQKMDRCTDAAGVVLLHDQMALDYAGRMRVKKKSSATSMHVSEAIDYIYQHVLERITVDELADVIHVSPNYLSRSFKQETGVSVSEYIRQRKIDAAKNLLRYSKYELAEIANLLSYSSQSHFIQQFRAAVGMTPKAYRDANYRNMWNINRDGQDQSTSSISVSGDSRSSGT